MRGRKAPSVVYPGHRKGVVRESGKKKKENDIVEGRGGTRGLAIVYTYKYMCVRKRREKESAI